MPDRLPAAMLRRLAANSGWNLVGQVIPMLAALAAAPQLVRLLGEERFGLLGIIWAVLGYLGIFEFGIGRALTQTISQRRGEDSSREVWAGLLALALIGLGVALAGAAFAHCCAARAFRLPAPLGADVRGAFFGVALAIPFVLVSTGLRGILEAYGEFRVLSFVRSAAGSLMFLGPWAVCLSGPSLSRVVAVLLVIRVATFAVLLLVCLGHTRALRSAPRWSAAALRRLLGFGGWVTVSQLVGAFWGLADRLLLGLLASPRAVAYYVTPNEIVSRSGVVSNSLVTAAFPDFARAGQAPARASGLFLSSTRWLFWFICPVSLLLAAAGPSLLGLWLGPAFAREAAPLLRWLIAYQIVNHFLAFPVAFLQARGRPQTFAKLQLVELPVVLVLLAAGIVHSGALGAASVMFARVVAETILVTLEASACLATAGGKAWGQLIFFLAGAGAVLAVGSSNSPLERMAAALVAGVLLIGGSEFLLRRANRAPGPFRLPLTGHLGESS